MTKQSAKNKNEDENKKKFSEELRRFRLVFFVIAVYFLTLAVLIFATQSEDYRYRQSPTEIYYPDSIVWILYFAYYGMPFLMASVFGFIFRPFWRNFRTILILIVLVQWAYSSVVYTLRYGFLVQWRAELQSTQDEILQVYSFKHKFYDDDKNGLMDRVEIIGEFDPSLLANGEYLLEAFISQMGERLPQARIGVYRFILEDNTKSSVIARDEKERAAEKAVVHQYSAKATAGKDNQKKNFVHSFQADLRRYQQYFTKGPIDIDLELRKILRVNEAIKNILFLSRWAPFFRATSWEGDDPDLRQTVIEIQRINQVYSLSLLPLNLPQHQVFFKRYRDDFSRDLNQNGFFEEIVIPFEVYSHYEGTVYLSAKIDKAQGKIFRHEAKLNTGFNTVNLVIKAQELKNFNQDGPYVVQNIVLTNTDSACEEKPCPKRIKAPFVEYFGNFKTQGYRVSQME